MQTEPVFIEFLRFSDNGGTHERAIVGLEGVAALAIRRLVAMGEFGVHRLELLAAIPALARAGIGLFHFAHFLYDGREGAQPEWCRLIPEQEVRIVNGVAGNA